MSAYPEHDKLAKVSDDSQKLGEFLDWLIEEKHVTLAFELEDEPPDDLIQGLLARYFEIDLDKIAEEKLAMIESIRELNRKP